MHIGIASPISVQEFLIYLNSASKENGSKIIGLKAPSVDTLVHGLLSRNHSVSIYTLSHEVEDLLILTGEKLQIYINPLRKKGWKRVIDLFHQEALKIKQSIKLDPKIPDIIHANWTYEYALGVISFRKIIPIVITVHDWAPKIFEFNPNYYRFFRLILNNRIFKYKPVNFTSNSKYIQNKIRKRWSINSYHIPNAINTNFLSNKHRKKVFSGYVISITNSLEKRKNINNLLKAFKLVSKDLHNLKLVLVGEPFTYSNKTIIQWRKSGLLNNVELIGSVEHNNLIALIDNAAVMVHPSLEESFGNTLIEAMARKIAVIGGENSGAVPLVLENGKCGYLCNVLSIDSIKDAILTILGDDELRNKLIANAYIQIQKKYSQDIVTEQTINYYQKILNAEN